MDVLTWAAPVGARDAQDDTIDGEWIGEADVRARQRALVNVVRQRAVRRSRIRSPAARAATRNR